MLQVNFEEPNFLKKTFLTQQFDGESAMWQFVNMYKNPSSVFRWMRAHRHTKGSWARDDPGFIILEVVVILSIAVVWYILPFSPYSFRYFLKSIASFLLVDYVLMGILVSGLLYIYLNKWGKSQAVTPHAVDQDVEWRFCFDCFTNGFVAIIADIDIPFIIIFFYKTIVKRSTMLSNVFIPNFIIFIALAHFTILTVQCIQVLPFVKRMNYILFCLPLLVLFLFSIAASFSFLDVWSNYHLGAKK